MATNVRQRMQLNQQHSGMTEAGHNGQNPAIRRSVKPPPPKPLPPDPSRPSNGAFSPNAALLPPQAPPQGTPRPDEVPIPPSATGALSGNRDQVLLQLAGDDGDGSVASGSGDQNDSEHELGRDDGNGALELEQEAEEEEIGGGPVQSFDDNENGAYGKVQNLRDFLKDVDPRWHDENPGPGALDPRQGGKLDHLLIGNQSGDDQDPPAPVASDPSIVGRADIGIPNPNASYTARMVGGALVGGVGGAVGTAAVAAGGTMALLGIIGSGMGAGAILGSVGGPIGIAVGGGVGALVGLGYGLYSASRARTDYLDTSRSNSFQRGSWYSLPRSLMPKNVGRRILRVVKPPRRFFLTRAVIGIKRGIMGVSQDEKLLKFEDRGRNARPEEARADFRYALASHVAYSGVSPDAENAHLDGLASKSSYTRETRHNKDLRDKYARTPDAMGVDELRELLYPNGKSPTDPKKLRQFRANPEAFLRAEYTRLHKDFKGSQAGFRIRTEALDHRGGPDDWDFKALGSRIEPLSPESEVFRRLPQSLQDSLARGRGAFRDPDTGNNVRILFDRKNKEVVIAFNGTAGGPQNLVAGGQATTRAQQRTNVTNYAGGYPPSAKQAVAIGRAVRAAVEDYNRSMPPRDRLAVVSTGHSRGGLLATVEAIKNRGKAVAFNPEAMGAGLRDYCGVYMTESVPKEVDITVYSTRNDLASGSGFGSGVGNVMETGLGILPLGSITTPPVIFGDRRILPKAPGTSAHRDSLEHMAYAGGGGQPAPKARWRTGPEVDDARLYRAEHRLAPAPRLAAELASFAGRDQASMRKLFKHMDASEQCRREQYSELEIDYNTFAADLAEQARRFADALQGQEDDDRYRRVLNQALDAALAANIAPGRQRQDQFMQDLMACADREGLLAFMHAGDNEEARKYEHRLDDIDFDRFADQLEQAGKLYLRNYGHRIPDSADEYRAEMITRVNRVLWQNIAGGGR